MKPKILLLDRINNLVEMKNNSFIALVTPFHFMPFQRKNFHRILSLVQVYIVFIFGVF